MKIVILDDYQDAVRRLDCFAKMIGALPARPFFWRVRKARRLGDRQQSPSPAAVRSARAQKPEGRLPACVRLVRLWFRVKETTSSAKSVSRMALSEARRFSRSTERLRMSASRRFS